MTGASSSSLLPPRVHAYVGAIVQEWRESGGALVSIILFGSTVTGGFSGTVSDVDLILVLPEGAGPEDKNRLRDAVTNLEILHKWREPSGRPGVLEALFVRITANDRSCFVCTRGDLLSGRVSRILGLHPAQALFVDRIVIPSILYSAVTVWGEELLVDIPVLPIRRIDIFIAFFGIFSQVVTTAVLFPVLASATKYALAALKHSVHSCYFCYHAKTAALKDEVDFFQRRLGPSRALKQLLALRQVYAPSFLFVVRCIPAVMRLHLRTAAENRFPRTVRGSSA